MTAQRDEEIVDLLRDVNRALRERLLSGIGGEKRPLATLSLMRALAESPGLSLNELARRRYLPKSLVSVIVADLSADGLVKKSADRLDQRLVRLRLTAAGTRELERWRSSYQALAAKEIGALSPDAAADLLSGLRALRDLVAPTASDRVTAR